tara:strand:+ start:822 stop:1052 length:231 start_codon:yes stop_codon:yes gene_type:complete
MLKPTTTIALGNRYGNVEKVEPRVSGWSGSVNFTFEVEDSVSKDVVEVSLKHATAKALLAQLRKAVKESNPNKRNS